MFLKLSMLPPWVQLTLKLHVFSVSKAEHASSMTLKLHVFSVSKAEHASSMGLTLKLHVASFLVVKQTVEILQVVIYN